MNRIWFALAAMFIIITICILEFKWMDNATNALQQKVDELVEVAEAESNSSISEDKLNDVSENKQQIGEELNSGWNTLHNTLAIFIDHQRLEDIDQSMAIISDCLIREDEESELFIESARLKAQLDNLKDTELPKLNNIL